MTNGQFSAEERRSRRQGRRGIGSRRGSGEIMGLGAAGIAATTACSHQNGTQTASAIEAVLLLTHSKIQQVFRTASNIL
jgi:hypothetical protein